MAQWIVYAWTSMFFAGFTSVIAKKGLTGISGDLGLTVRTCFVFVFVLMFAAIVVPHKEWSLLKPANWYWLAGSAVTTFLSWMFYYRAIKLGEVSTVALIDKGSVVVSIIMATWLLQESLSVHKVIGAVLIAIGLFVISKG